MGKSKLKIIGTPRTIGELKKLIEKYPDNIEFGFRNQPMQDLCEVKYDKKFGGGGLAIVFEHFPF